MKYIPTCISSECWTSTDGGSGFIGDGGTACIHNGGGSGGISSKPVNPGDGGTQV